MGSVKTAGWIAAIYVGYFVLFHVEQLAGVDYGIARLVTNIVAPVPEQAWHGYLQNGRFIFFQPEPRVSAIAYSATVLAFVVAWYRTKPNLVRFLAVLACCAVALLANSFTAVGFVSLTLLFALSPKWAFNFVLGSLAASILVGLALLGIENLLPNLHEVLTTLVRQEHLEGQFGFTSAATLSLTAASWWMSIKALLASPIWGLGAGGFAPFVIASGTATELMIDSNVEDILTGNNPNYVPSAHGFVFKILAETGLLGVALIYWGMVTLMRETGRAEKSAHTFHALLLRYLICGMVLSWVAYSSFLNPFHWILPWVIGWSHMKRNVLISGKRAQYPALIPNPNASSE